MEKLDAQKLTKKANEMRIVCLEMLKVAGSGHVGGSLSAMDILTALYFNILNINPKAPGITVGIGLFFQAGTKRLAMWRYSLPVVFSTWNF